MIFLSEYTIKKTGQSQIHVHDVCLSHGHSEQMLETLCQDNSLKEYPDVILILELWMFENFTQIS